MLNIPPKDNKNQSINKVCNSVNCFFLNEYLSDVDYDINSPRSNECVYCSYNYDNLCEIKRFILCELEKNNTSRRQMFKQKLFALIYAIFLFSMFCVSLLYFFFKTRFIVK